MKDFAWYIFQNILTAIAEAYSKGEITEEKYYSENKDIYWEMTLFQRRYENKKGNNTMKLVLHNDLLYNKCRSELELNAVVIAVKGCCTYCDIQNGKTVPIDEAIKNPPMDCTKCTNKYGCRCTYAYQIRSNENSNFK